MYLSVIHKGFQTTQEPCPEPIKECGDDYFSASFVDRVHRPAGRTRLCPGYISPNRAGTASLSARLLSLQGRVLYRDNGA
jgi:hypothetical protein